MVSIQLISCTRGADLKPIVTLRAPGRRAFLNCCDVLEALEMESPDEETKQALFNTRRTLVIIHRCIDGGDMEDITRCLASIRANKPGNVTTHPTPDANEPVDPTTS